MIYVEIDLDRERSQIATLDEQGTELLSCRVANDPEALKVVLGELGGELQVALEATYGWEWLADLLEAGGARAASLASGAHEGDRCGAGEDGRGRRGHARASAPHRSAAGGVRRPARAARPP